VYKARYDHEWLRDGNEGKETWRGIGGNEGNLREENSSVSASEHVGGRNQE
jgi:hypothetical protein